MKALRFVEEYLWNFVTLTDIAFPSCLHSYFLLIVKEGFRNMEPKGKVIFVRVVLG